MPRRKGRPIHLEGLPITDSMMDLDKSNAIVIEAMTNGEISPDEAETVLPIMEGKLEVAKDCIKDEIWPYGDGPPGARNENSTAQA